MYFNPEVEYEVIRYAVSHKLYIPLVYPSKNWIDSTQAKTPTPTFHIYDPQIYTNEGHIIMMELLDISTNCPNITKYTIKFFHWNTKVGTKYLLK